MKMKAALATKAGKPLEIVNVTSDGPKDNEVLVEIMATGVCHTDEFTIRSRPRRNFSSYTWARRSRYCQRSWSRCKILKSR